MRPASLLVCALTSALLAACAAFSGEKLALYGVDPQALPAASERAAWQILIDEPRAVDPVSSSRVVLVAPDGEYTVLPGVRWREAAPEMVRSLLLEAFESCACVAGAARNSSSLRGDYLLTTDLRRFELLDGGDGVPTAIAEVVLTLVRSTDGRALGTRRIGHSVPARRRSADAGIAALGAALNAVVADSVPWSLSVVNEAAR